MATLFEYKCKKCGYTKSAHPKGHDTIMSGELYTYLCEDCKERLEKNPLRILDCKVDQDNKILKEAPKTLDYLNEESRDRFETNNR